jgi:DDE superfamily endonuclease
MDQLIPSLALLVAPFREAFARPETFATFQCLLSGWILTPGPHTISEVWQATGRSGKYHWDSAYSFFSDAKWEWDDIAKILILRIVASLIPTGHIFIVVDDTLCHKRGAKVSFGGFFLDAVTSSKKKKNFRFGVNWVVVGLSMRLPFRSDRYFTLPVVWRAYRKKGTEGHRTRTELAAEMARLIAGWLPERKCLLLGDNAYLNGTVLTNRPANLEMIGPLRWNAALYQRPEPRKPGTKGRTRTKGERLPSLKSILENVKDYPAETLTVTFGETTRKLRVQRLTNILWPSGMKTEPVTVIVIHDVAGEWRDEVLLSTSVEMSAELMIESYCRRWSIEVVFEESKQLLGLHDPQVRCEKSVERAHPFAWLVTSLTILWYVESGQNCPKVERNRPWYRTEPSVTFSSMLSVLRLQHWEILFSQESRPGQCPQKLLHRLKHWLAAVR